MTQDNGKADLRESESRNAASDSQQPIHYWERHRLIRGAHLRCGLKAVLQEINDQTDLDHFKPTFESIANCAGLSPRRVSDAIKKLRQMGLLHASRRTIFGGGLGAYEYEINWDALAAWQRVKFGRYKRTRRPKQFTPDLPFADDGPDETSTPGRKRPDETSGPQDVTNRLVSTAERPDATASPQDTTKRPVGQDESSAPQDTTNRPHTANGEAKKAAADLLTRLLKCNIYQSVAENFLTSVPHEYLGEVLTEYETHSHAKGIGPGALAKIIRRRERITPPKATNAQLQEQRRRAQGDVERIRRHQEREQVEREQVEDTALRQLWDELTQEQREEIRSKVFAKNAIAARLGADSSLVLAACLGEFREVYSL